MNKKPQDLEKVSHRLKDLFAHKNWSLLWQIFMLGQQWPSVVGKNVAKKSEPAYIQNDTLWIYVESSVLMQHLQPQKLSLLDKVREILPDAGIKDIRWAMRPAKPTDQKTASMESEIKKAAPEDKEDFDAIVSTLENKQCRDALQKLWKTYNGY